MLAFEGIKQAIFFLHVQKDEKLFSSTLGSRLDMTTYLIFPMISAVAVTSEDSQSRSFNPGGKAVGWEWIASLNLPMKAQQIAEEALIKVKADSLGEEKRRSLILDPAHLSLTMHESVGHPTELDRCTWAGKPILLAFLLQHQRN